jgi:hypothetical protein
MANYPGDKFSDTAREIERLKALLARAADEEEFFNVTNLKDLDYICEIAQAYYETSYGLPKEEEWLERIRKYRELIRGRIRELE